MELTINENTIRSMVSKALKRAIKENYENEYRTKGSLNKKTLEKQMNQTDKTSGAASLEKPVKKPVPQNGEEDYNPDWDDYTMDNIKGLYNDDEEEFDDSTAGGEYKIDPSNPYFIDENGKEVDADAIGNFHNGFAIVKKGGKVNYVNSDGKIISSEWFHACNDFEGGFGMVSNGTKRNFVDGQGNLLLQTWVDRAGDFMGDVAPVIINGSRYDVDRNGNIS